MNRLAALALSLALPLSLVAQEKPAGTETQQQIETRLHTTDCDKMPSRQSESNCTEAHKETRVIQLHNVTQQQDANEILVALRNILSPSVKIYLVASQDAIVVETWPQELDRAEALVRKLDVPRRTYRVTFTIITSEGGKRIGVEHYSLVAADGQRATSKQGSKIPVATGSYNPNGSPNSAAQTQFTYLDVGMNFDVTPTTTGSGVAIKAKIEQSSTADPVIIAGVNEPVIRQSVYEGVTTLPLGKSVALSSLDVPTTTRHIDVEAMVEPM